MTNEQVKAQWEASGRKALVQFKSGSEWLACRDPIEFRDWIEYRIHPTHLHLCKTTAPKPHGKYDYARKMIDAIESLQPCQRFTDGCWSDVLDWSPWSIGALNDPLKVRIKPKTVRRILYLYRADGEYKLIGPNTEVPPNAKFIRDIEVEEEQ